MADYGYLNGYTNENERNVSTFRTQVYKATHEGENYLPFMNRSFISFSFGGRNIEDFNLIATVDGDRMNRPAYAEINDIVSDYDILDGQYYWGTQQKSNKLELQLSTDAITQKELDDFLHWFAPGQNRELILAEHPNRAIIARAGEAPVINMLPFEQKIEMKVGGYSYYTSTTVYKGDISLVLVMDEPTWYSKINIFGEKDSEGIYRDIWTDANGQVRSVFDSPDALKIAAEDGIPISSMLQVSMLLGDNIFANMEGSSGAIIATGDDDTSERSIIATVSETGMYISGARIAGPIMDDTTGITNLAIGNYGYFYYAGTAKAKPILTFTLTPAFYLDYIDIPKNKHSAIEPYYNTITIESVHKKEFKFSLPAAYAGYNQAIYIFKTMSPNNDTWTDVSLRLREQVKHYYARKWATAVGKYFAKQHTIVQSSDISEAITYMKYFITSQTVHSPLLKSTFSFDSNTGKAIGKIGIRLPTNTLPNGAAEWADFGNPIILEEDVGDMVRSEYLIIEDRNYPNSNGEIVRWESTNNITKAYSHRIYHDVTGGLDNIFIEYKNMYL